MKAERTLWLGIVGLLLTALGLLALDADTHYREHRAWLRAIAKAEVGLPNRALAGYYRRLIAEAERARLL